ncbi:helix-turn-helix domain-containing protein [Bradyrhizobium sp.]|uniref:helix-turn-helix domain-containing protein n=1 Tax=Bradyrhizobium sp. TaxID=376 RepID=UPI0040382159
MPYGSPWSEQFVRQLSDKDVRSEFVADQVRARLAQLIRALREQPDRNWTQAELGERAGKPQNVISRFEDPNYGKMSLQSLLDVAAAFDLPVWIDMPEWEDWFALIGSAPAPTHRRSGFDLDELVKQANMPASFAATGGAALAAAQAIMNMVISPQRPQALGAVGNTNALTRSSNVTPAEKISTAMSTAVDAKSVAA